MKIKTEWFAHYTEAALTRRSGTKVDFGDGVVFIKWFPETDLDGFNVTYIDNDLTSENLDCIIEQANGYSGEIVSREDGLAEKFDNKLSFIGFNIVRKIKKTDKYEFESSLKMKKVSNIDEYRLWAKTASKVFDEYDEEFVFNSYKNDWDLPSLGCYIGFDGDKAVAVSQINGGEHVAGLFWVGVVDGYRKNGYGRDIAAFALNDYIDQGYDTFVLIASEMAVKTYKALGFHGDDVLFSYKLK